MHAQLHTWQEKVMLEKSQKCMGINCVSVYHKSEPIKT